MIDYLDYIKTFPLNDEPETFGMHQNADISYAQALTTSCLTTLLLLQPKTVGGAASSQEEIITNAAYAILGQIPEEFDLESVSKKLLHCFTNVLGKVIVTFQISGTLQGIVEHRHHPRGDSLQQTVKSPDTISKRSTKSTKRTCGYV